MMWVCMWSDPGDRDLATVVEYQRISPYPEAPKGFYRAGKALGSLGTQNVVGRGWNVKLSINLN